MKLLDQHTIQKKKNDEFKQEIDEGAKLAKKIDTLRQVSSSEEVRLRKFRDQSLKSTKEEIDRLITVKSELVLEIDDLEERKRQALIPLHSEWEKVNKENTLVEDKKQSLISLEKQLNKIEQEIECRSKSIFDEEGRITEKQKTVNKILYEVSENQRELQRLISEAKNTKEKVNKELDERTRNINLEEENITIQSLDNHNLKINLLNKEKELNDRERAINDKYQTLLRINKKQ